MNTFTLPLSFYEMAAGQDNHLMCLEFLGVVSVRVTMQVFIPLEVIMLT